MTIFLFLFSSLALAAEAPKAPAPPIKSVCEWSIPNPNADQAKWLADIKKKAGCK